MEEILRKNVSSILEVILQRKQSLNSNEKEQFKRQAENKQLYFRGENKLYSRRTPSLYLQKKLIEQGSEYYYRTLLNELGRADYEDNTSLVRLISELQHYGAKTRMLDITKNPLIALYFAVEKKDKKDDEEAGYIYIYHTTANEEKFDTGHTVAIKCALNLIDYAVINDFIEACTKLKNKESDDLTNKTCEEILNKYVKDNSDMKNAINKFMELLNQRARVRENLKYPIKIFDDLSRSHIILPSKATDRIRQQQGAFIFPKYVNTNEKSIDEIQKEIDESIQELNAVLIGEKGKGKVKFSRIKINGRDKKAIRTELEQLGITAGFVYPDIEHQSKALLEE